MEDKKVVYIVQGNDGEPYSLYSWIRCAYTCEDKAKAKVKELNENEEVGDYGDWYEYIKVELED